MRRATGETRERGANWRKLHLPLDSLVPPFTLIKPLLGIPKLNSAGALPHV
jgi:hypothetical protein